ncbi:MAG: ATP-binding protein [Bacteroidia bacterium]
MYYKNILTLKFTGIVAFLLLVFSLILFLFSEVYFQNDFEKNLKKTSINLVDVLVDSNEINNELVQTIFKHQINIISSQTLTIIDNKNEIQIGENKISNYDKVNLLNDIMNKETSCLFKGDTIIFAFNYKGYKVITSVVDMDGISKMNFIKNSLFLFFIMSIILSLIIGNFIAKQTLIPINNIIKQVEKFTEINLNERLKTGNGKDEIALLAITFNQLLDRLENSFRLQKTFVSNASHEFRTPLTVMKGQIEVLLIHERSNEVYLKTFTSLLEDINNQIDLINGLGALANANAMFPNNVSSRLSIIELLDECVSELYKNKKYQVFLNIEELQEDENTMYLNGNHALIRSALMNIMDNACKFNKTPSCQVNLVCNPEFMVVTVMDQGLGISKEDLANIFESFFRSNNTRHIQGHGIGLSLVKKIVEYYNGKITVISELGKGTNMSVFFPNVNTRSDFKV